MRKLIVPTLALLALLVPASVKAEDNNMKRYGSDNSEESRSLQNKKDEIKASNLKKREAFTKKLGAIKDQRKKTVVERVETNLAKVNGSRTERLTQITTKLDMYLSKISENASKAADQGKNTAAADAAIIKATDALSTAKTAIADQAQKDYSPEISDETTLRQNVSQSLATFRTDMKAVIAKVVLAKEAVAAAARETAKLRTTKVTPTITN